jgi:hypothetical protein
MSENVLSGLQAKLTDLEKKAKETFYSHVKANLTQGDFVNSIMTRLIAVLDEIQSEYFSGVETDPTNPARQEYVRAIREEVQKNIATFASSMSMEGSSGSFDILSDEFIGKGKEDDTKGNSPIQWLIFFIEGNLEDNLLWVDEEFIQKYNWKVSGGMGRFGAGFLVQASPEMMTLYGDHKHPQSGKPGMGSEAFIKAVTEDDLNQFVIQPAVTATTNYISNILK